MAEPIDNLRQIRLDKLEKLKSLGINPYPSTVLREQTISEIKKLDQHVSVAGRVVGKRGHGKLVFIDLADETGKIQIVFKEDLIGPEKFKLLDLVDIADFLAVQGESGKTETQESSIFATDFQIITKTLLPLPNQWFGFKEVEERYRKRYLDMILNPEVKKRIEARGQLTQAIREFLVEKKFVEAETPTLQPVYGGGFAKPFVTHHNKLDSDFYLRISDEMYLKRLIVGGFEKVFEITKVFRNEGVDMDHNPEFTMFEAMIAYKDYQYGMDLIEGIIEYTAEKVLGNTEFIYQGTSMSVKRPWPRYRVVDAIEKFTELRPLSWNSLTDAKEALENTKPAKEKAKEFSHLTTVGEMIAFAFEELVEDKLIQPTMIYDYPVEISPLAKKCPDPRFTQRFEMFAFGSELGNNYTELNDPIDLRQRFVEEKKREKAGFEEAHQTDYDYLTAIEHGFPPACGIAIGIDRLTMLLTDAPSIKEVIAFPLLRPEQNKIVKQDFGKKMVIVIDKSLPAWQIMNTSAHTAAFLGNKMTDPFDTGKNFATKDYVALPRNSQYPIITLEATTAELKKLLTEVQKSGLLYLAYVPEMMETTNDKKLETMLKEKTLDQINLTGIGIFGPNAQVEALTKDFKLWGKDE